VSAAQQSALEEPPRARDASAWLADLRAALSVRAVVVGLAEAQALLLFAAAPERATGHALAAVLKPSLLAIPPLARAVPLLAAARLFLPSAEELAAKTVFHLAAPPFFFFFRSSRETTAVSLKNTSVLQSLLPKGGMEGVKRGGWGKTIGTRLEHLVRRKKPRSATCCCRRRQPPAAVSHHRQPPAGHFVFVFVLLCSVLRQRHHRHVVFFKFVWSVRLLCSPCQTCCFVLLLCLDQAWAEFLKNPVIL
jgi:hypothetical protein